MNATLLDQVGNLTQLPGANVVLVCEPSDGQRLVIVFVDGMGSSADPGRQYTSCEPLVVLSAKTETLVRFLRGEIGLQDSADEILLRSKDVGAVMVLSGILQSPRRPTVPECRDERAIGPCVPVTSVTPASLTLGN